MDNKQPSYSRLNRFEKKRRNTRWLSIFIIIGSILIVAFIAILVFSNPDDDITLEPNEGQVDPAPDEEDQGTEPDQNQDSNEPDDTSDMDEADDEDESNESDDASSQEPDDPNIEMLESGEDNVEFSYRSNWDPISTEQSEPHEISWDQNSLDWEEMMKAAEQATDVSVDDMNYLWVSGDGPQSVIATFSDVALDEHYRVYIMWIENQGWQPQRVDMLITHDQMHNFN